jgi:hypothetical protein
MNILIYDVNKIPLEQLKHVVDAVKQVSDSDDWIALPKGIDVIQDAPVEYLVCIRDALDKRIREFEEK